MSEENITFKFNKKDICLIAGLVVFAVIAFLVVFLFKAGRSDGGTVAVMIDGETVKEFSLDEDVVYDIISDEGRNVLVIEDGEAYVSSADCPDGICTAHIPISKVDDEIICVPHKVVIIIK